MDHERMRRLHGGKGDGMRRAAFDIVLKSRRDIAERTIAFVFEKPVGFRFRAGQHVRMTLIGLDQPDERENSRFLSIASTPQDDDLVFAMRMRDTAFKRALLAMPPGGKVRIEILLDVPMGAFALHEDGSRPAVMLCGGIGIVPAYAMIRDATQRRLPQRIVLFYSNHRPEDAAWLAELEELVRENPNFTLVATMTGPDVSDWTGETGRIDRTLLERHLDRLKGAVWYVAGLPGMAEAMQALLRRAHVKRKDIKSEAFAGFTQGDHRMAGHSPKRHVLGIGVVLLIGLIGLVVAVHLGAAAWLYHYGLDLSRLKGPVLYGAVAVVLVLAAVKVWLLLRGRHGR